MLTTRRKILFARLLAAPLHTLRRTLGLGDHVEVWRGGVRWRLDLREGIDFAIYLLGRYERSTVRAYERLITAGEVVLDVGANIGGHSLHMARCVGSEGRVVCFEPTEYAFGKLRRNVELNPGLSTRITLERIMLAGSIQAELPSRLFSSWPLERGDDLHALHGGRVQSTAGASVTTLDEYLAGHALPRVSFLKMDVDGYECEVLAGAAEMLRDHRPRMALELAPHVLEEKGRTIGDLFGMLSSAGYRLLDLSNGRAIPMNEPEIRGHLRRGGSINVIARAD